MIDERRPGGEWFKKFMGGNGLDLARLTLEPVYDFIDEQKGSPFFIWYAPELPHYPFNAPDKYYQLYAEKEMTESARRYYANCSWFADGIGSLISHVKEKGLFGNTLLIYVNDNGWEQDPNQEFRHDSMRWHNGGDEGKLGLRDQSFHTPIIFSWPNQIKGSGAKIELVHIAATILDLLGHTIPSNWFGKSLKGALNNMQTRAARKMINWPDRAHEI